jgi:hypothetical protein
MRNLVIILASLVALGSTARAECRQEDQTAPVKARSQMIDGKRVIVIEKTIVICGHPPKPAVAYLTTPKTVDYTWETLKEDLVSRILQSVTNGDVR